MKRLLLLALPACLLVTGSRRQSTNADHYLDQFIDTTVSPRDDFFHYSVGKWLRDHPMPSSERAWGIYNVVQEETYQRLLGISQASARAKTTRGSNAQKIEDFYAASMDTITTAQLGLKPLAGEFARIAAIVDKKSLADVIARQQYIGVGPAYGLFIGQDEKKSDRYLVHLYQGGLGMPDRDYYFDADDRAKMLRREYVTHVARMFNLLGDDSAQAATNAATVMSLETELAGASRKLADLRDPIANYNAMSLAGVGAVTPSIKWREHLAAGNIRGVDSVVVGQPEFFKQLEASIQTRPLDDWKTYLRWQLANAFAAQAGGAFDAEHFRFFGTILNGTPEQRPRWKRTLDAEEGYLGDALSQLYVRRYFSPKTKSATRS